MTNKLDVKFKILDHNFFTKFGLPSYGSTGSAGLDLRANLKGKESITVQPNETVLIDTGLAIFLDNPNYAAFIYPRSGQGHKRGIVLGNLVGVIDSDYQGELKISLWNRSGEVQVIENGERIAQLVVQLVTQVNLIEVEDFSDTERGSSGFGSTGVN
ncbi:deoxyuridine 5'-triphosphate nucleotidohydrolase [Psittacicella hinzii]|uniref:Deoxyuridine 5'-triphosphate nucleotidohydrolase n=1 Tax=Psittacicella hinzii TaxID=2028575 RepID=A0A3A1YAD8_9GAMM|nr:dUTP diphosphatase [Psittacicella hinzii]RIY33124.1 deoxyuridine 5'-triphosphate nucleotidohydrolase [Psittacicella hinzii]